MTVPSPQVTGLSATMISEFAYELKEEAQANKGWIYIIVTAAFATKDAKMNKKAELDTNLLTTFLLASF
jgi:hypothetical protein